MTVSEVEKSVHVDKLLTHAFSLPIVFLSLSQNPHIPLLGYWLSWFPERSSGWISSHFGDSWPGRYRTGPCPVQRQPGGVRGGFVRGLELPVC